VKRCILICIELLHPGEAASASANKNMLPGGGTMAELPALKLIGYWAQSEGPSLYPHPKRLVRPDWHEEDRGRIAAYLRAGTVLAAYCGFSCCRICGICNGSREFTDGDWAWPEGLAHYVEAHAVCLPDEIVATMAARGWQVPTNRGEPGCAPVDESFWVGWSARLNATDERRTSALLQSLVDRVSPMARARARRREVELDFLFYCQVCGARRVKLAQHEAEALCSAECRRLQDVAICYFGHKSGTFSDREVFEATGLPVSSLPRRMYCKWCGQATMKMQRDLGRCTKCGGARYK
jgi:hypothetical protein